MSQKQQSPLTLAPAVKVQAPSSEELIQLLLAHLDHRTAYNSLERLFNFKLADFTTADQDLLLEELVEAGIRAKFVWFPAEKILQVQMPSELHEAIAEWILFILFILNQMARLHRAALCLALLGNDDELNINFEFGGQFTIHLRNPSTLPSDSDTRLTGEEKERLHWQGFIPDGCIVAFSEGTDKYVQSLPQIVFEAAHSQTIPSVLQKAWKYLYWEPREIHAVVIYKMGPIGLEGTFRSEISVWRRAGDSIASSVRHACPGVSPPEAESYASNSSSPTTSSSESTLIEDSEAWQIGRFVPHGQEQEIQGSPPIVVIDENDPSEISGGITLNLFDIFPYCEGPGDEFAGVTIPLDLVRLRVITRRRLNAMRRKATTHRGGRPQ